MTRWVEPGPDFAGLFATFRRSAWRLETYPAYEVDEEIEPFRRFAESGEVDVSYLSEWLIGVENATVAGRRFERVRVLADPPTPYQDFEMAVAAHNAAAGEDIRSLTTEQASSLGLPQRYDFWIFDDARIAILHFSPAGRLLTTEVRDDPDTLARHLAWKNSAWQHAEPSPPS
ncbi:DUF6879 family protein [Pseudonocardia sp. HH130630-07]|uniref:DUF6879 family protein n=1 Tax=Pseudonocardia sp. HH130630-07 TaxID=1690815 RepID=UPI000814E9AE|nr:DUF6879 family protein [Pseudonocardia sp. HH130630-07]ANY06428.1 hypothetical protein AFB00_09135 [Pseudonocardia sp. HH130630-07]